MDVLSAADKEMLARADATRQAEAARDRVYWTGQLREQAAKPRGNRSKLADIAFRCWELGIPEPQILLDAQKLTVEDLRQIVRDQIQADYQYELDTAPRWD